MRIKLGRPDLGGYADRFSVPAATPDSPLAVTFLGVSTLLFEAADGQLLVDGYFSRPGLRAVAVGRIAPDRARILAALSRAGVGGVAPLAAVVPVHTHFDHALDSAPVAGLTGARLVGGASVAQLADGHRLPADRVTVVADGDTVTAGGYEVTFVASAHCPPDRYPGAITRPVRPPVRASAYRCGDAWSLLVTHPMSGRTALVQGSAGYRVGALRGYSAAVAYLGVGQLGLRPEPYLRRYWAETVGAVGARRVVLTHWDDFFRPLDRPLRALPYAGDDLDASMRVLGWLAERDGVTLEFPTVWAREDPWVGGPVSSS